MELSVKSNVISLIPEALSSLSFDLIEERLIAIKKARSVKEVHRYYLRDRKYLDSLIFKSKSLTDLERVNIYESWYNDLAILRDECKMMLVSLEDFQDSDRKSEVITNISNLRNAIPTLQESLKRKRSAISFKLVTEATLKLFEHFIEAVKDFTGIRPDVNYSCTQKDGCSVTYSIELMCTVKSLDGYYPSDYYLHVSHDLISDSIEVYTKYHSDNPYLKSILTSPEQTVPAKYCNTQLANDLIPIIFLNNGFVTSSLYDKAIKEKVVNRMSDLRVSFASNRLFATISSKLNKNEVRTILEVFCYFLFGSTNIKNYLVKSQTSKSSWLFEFIPTNKFPTRPTQTLKYRLPYIKDLFSVSNNAFTKFSKLSTEE